MLLKHVGCTLDAADERSDVRENVEKMKFLVIMGGSSWQDCACARSIGVGERLYESFRAVNNG